MGFIKKSFESWVLLLAGLWFIQNVAFAQTPTQMLSLGEAIRKATQNNRMLTLAKLDEQIAAANYQQTDAIYLPQVGLSYGGLLTNNPLNAFGLKLQQQSISATDFNPNLLNHPTNTPDFSTKIEIQQPIINMDSWYMRRVASKQSVVYGLKTRRTKEYLTFEVKKAFGQLQLAHQAVAVLEDALKTTQAVYTFTENRYQQGLLQKSDLLNVQVQISTITSNLKKAKSNIGNASDYLGLLMGLPMGTLYAPVDNATENTVPIDSISTPPNNRADYMAMEKAIEASDLMIQSTKKSALPKLNAFGSYQLNDSRMLGFGANAYLVGAQLSWDVFKGFRTKNTIKSQTLERNKIAEQLVQQKEQGSMELSKTKRDIRDAATEIAAQKVSIAQAEEALRILQNRYGQGLVNTTDVLMASTQLSQQKFALAQAVFGLGVSQAYLQFLTITINK